MTKNLNGTLVNNLFNDTTFSNLFVNLYSRWLDERGHEDINEYKRVLNDYVEGSLGLPITKMTKRPFGFEIKCDYDFKLKDGSTRTFKAVVAININSRGMMGWGAKPCM